MRPLRSLMPAILAAAVHAATPADAAAQTPEEFYKGKTLQIYVGFGVSGTYDTYARLLAEHIGRHLPGQPQAVKLNMEGAGSLRLANWLYSAAPKDGTVIATISRAAPFTALTGTHGGTSFEAARFTWIGSANDEVSTCVAWSTAPVKTFEQLRTTELVVGTDGAGADGQQFARLLMGLFGARLRIVTGYPGGGPINLAMERGEVQARCGWSWSGIVVERKQWIDEGRINVLVQFGLRKHPDLPHVPSALDLATTEEQRQVLQLVLARQPLGRPFVAPPGVPPERAAALRKAFMATMADPQFLAVAQRAKLEINPLPGDEVARLVESVFKTVTPAAVARTREILGGG